MALVNTHPDYLKDPKIWEIYISFLHTIKEQKNYWHARPRDVAHWWRKRTEAPQGQETPEMRLGTLVLENGQVRLH
jgi:hypothetical protein